MSVRCLLLSVCCRFEQILVLPGHRGSVWSLGMSPDASRLYSCGQDRSIRLWVRTEDLVFVEEERWVTGRGVGWRM